MALERLVSKNLQNELAVSDPRWRSKSILHFLNSIFASIAAILFGVTIPLWEKNFFHGQGPGQGDWTDALPIAPLVIASLFSCASMISIFTQWKRLSPVSNIITYLSILMFLLIAIVLAGVGAVFPYWRPSTTPNQNGIVLCNTLNMFTRECEPVMYRIGEMQIAGIIFSILVWLNTTLLVMIAVQEWRDLKYVKKHQLRKLQLYSDPEQQGNSPGARTGHQIKVSRSISRMSYLRPPSQMRFSRYSPQHKASTDSVGTTVPFVFIAEPEPSYRAPAREV